MSSMLYRIVRMYMHLYIYTLTNTYMHAYIHIYIHTCPHRFNTCNSSTRDPPSRVQAHSGHIMFATQILRSLHSPGARPTRSHGFLDHVSYVVNLQGCKSLSTQNQARLSTQNAPPDEMLASIHLLRGDASYGEHIGCVRSALAEGCAKQAAEDLVALRGRTDTLSFSDLARILLERDSNGAACGFLWSIAE
jgi:hypothetical protein